MITCIASPLVALGIEPEGQGAMTRATSSVADVAFLDLPQLSEWLVERRAVAGFLVALSAVGRRDREIAIRQARQARPATPIIACAAPNECSATLFVRAVQSGADHLTLDTPDDIERAIARALGIAMAAPDCADAAYRAVPWVPPLAQPMIAYCTMQATRRPTVARAAAALGVSERSLYRLFGGLGLPTPEATIGWCRLFVAAHMMDTGDRPVDAIAATLGFGSGSSLRNMFKRYTGLTLAAIDDRGGVARLARQYSAAACLPG